MPATVKNAPERATAQSMAKKQREISISEFFTKNRHLLGFDSPAKALLTTIKEAVDNSLDACEEAGILPDILIEILPVEVKKNGNGDKTLTLESEDEKPKKKNGAVAPGKEEHYRVIVQDNGPGIVREQIPKIFGKLLYGSKFHSLKQSRGQQGIGISAAGMYGQLTTGKPVVIFSRTQDQDIGHRFELMLDMKKNEPVIKKDEEVSWEPVHGTRVEIELTGSYKRGQHSVDTYLEQTAVANPHIRLTYRNPRGDEMIYSRAAAELPIQAKEIKPHPYGVELGILMRMLKDTKQRNISGFLRKEFCKVGPKACATIIDTGGFTPKKSTRHMEQTDVKSLMDAINSTKIPNPPTDCLAPIGEELVLAGLKQRFEADFYTSVSRPPSVYRGNPFQIEVGLAYGGDIPADKLAQVLRFANRVPLLYQASACAVHKSVLSNNWRSYGMQQSRGALPTGPLIIFVHMSSVWVPFTSESKEAVAHYPEIIKEIKLALQEAGRHLQRYIRRRVREKDALKKQSYIQKYIPHIGIALQEILNLEEIEKEEIITTLTDTLERSRKL